MINNIAKSIKINKIKYMLVFLILMALLIIITVISICVGDMQIEIGDIFGVIENKLFGTYANIKENVSAVIWNIRLPRIICAGFVGMGLAVSGVIFQGILQNPLADPYTLGISTGASFGASVAIIINLYFEIYFSTILAALIGAFVTLIFVILIAKNGGGFRSSNIIIAGIIISSILSSGVSFIKMLAGENVGAIVFWIMGSLSAKNWNDVLIIAPVSLICTVLAMFFAVQLDIMSLGDRNAQALGVDINKIRLLYLIIGSVITAVCVSVCGVIGFVGLVVPHLIRFSLTAKNKILIPFSAAFGAVLLILADTFTRNFSSGEIPVGVLTTLIGGPFFIFVFTHRKNNGEFEDV